MRKSRRRIGDPSSIGLLAALGGRPGQSATEMLATFADRLEALPAHLQRLAAQRAGLVALLPLLRQGGDAIREISDAPGIMDEETIELGKRLNSELFVLHRNITGLKNIIAAEVLPRGIKLLRMMNRLGDVIRKVLGSEDSKRYERNIKAITTALEALAVMAGVTAAIALGITLVQNIGLLISILKLLRINAILAAGPWGILVGLVALLAEDIYAFATGGKSMIGELAKQWGVLQERVSAHVDEMILKIDEFLEKIGKLLPSIRGVTDGIRGMLDTPETRTIDAVKKLRKELEAVDKQIAQAERKQDTEGLERLERRRRQLTGQIQVLEPSGPGVDGQVTTRQILEIHERSRRPVVQTSVPVILPTVATQKSAQQTTLSYQGGPINVSQVNSMQSVSPAVAAKELAKHLRKSQDEDLRNAAMKLKSPYRN